MHAHGYIDISAIMHIVPDGIQFSRFLFCLADPCCSGKRSVRLVAETLTDNEHLTLFENGKGSVVD